MKVVVVGASGNVGSAVIDALVQDPLVSQITGIARRLPRINKDKVTWASADITVTDLESLFSGADAVIHLAWAIQPSHNRQHLHAVNVEGSRRVFEAAGVAGVGTILYASSIGAYSPKHNQQPVDERWPTGGISTSDYSMQKAKVERILDDVEARFTDLRVVRLRPGLIFQGSSASEIHRYFLGPFVPRLALDLGRLPVIPFPSQLTLQAVHGKDVAEAFRLALHSSQAVGAFNVAADPVVGREEFLDLVGVGRSIDAPRWLLSGLVKVSWNARLQPTSPGWLDMAFEAPTMDIGRVRSELGWVPTMSSTEALGELLDGLRDGASSDTPPLRKEQ